MNKDNIHNKVINITEEMPSNRKNKTREAIIGKNMYVTCQNKNNGIIEEYYLTIIIRISNIIEDKLHAEL